MNSVKKDRVFFLQTLVLIKINRTHAHKVCTIQSRSSMSQKPSLVGAKIADRYCITGVIGTGGMGQVFRAIPFDDPSHDVAIKVILSSQNLSSEDLLRFQKEASLMSRLYHPNIICFHELGLLQSGIGGIHDTLGAGYYIVMEIANGVNLKENLNIAGR